MPVTIGARRSTLHAWPLSQSTSISISLRFTPQLSFPWSSPCRRTDLCRRGKDEEGSDSLSQQTPDLASGSGDVWYLHLCLLCPLDQRREGRQVCLMTELCKEWDGGRTSLPWLICYGLCFHIVIHVSYGSADSSGVTSAQNQLQGLVLVSGMENSSAFPQQWHPFIVSAAGSQMSFVQEQAGRVRIAIQAQFSLLGTSIGCLNYSGTRFTLYPQLCMPWPRQRRRFVSELRRESRTALGVTHPSFLTLCPWEFWSQGGNLKPWEN